MKQKDKIKTRSSINDNSNRQIFQNRLPSNNNDKGKEIQALQKKLLKKVYSDLFQSNPSFYQEKNLTYENFIYYFYTDILSTFDYSRKPILPYDQLLLEAEEKVMKKLPPSNSLLSMTPLQKKQLELHHKQSDDWAIVSKYQTQLYKEEERRQLESIAQLLKDYYQAITNQIEDKKTYEKELEKKRQQDLQVKYEKERDKLLKTQLSIKQNIVQLMKNEEYLSLDNKNRFKSQLTREAIVNQSLHSLLEENENVTNESKDVIKYKLGLITIEQQKAFVNKAEYTKADIDISNVVDQIMKQKDNQRLYKTIINASVTGNSNHFQKSRFKSMIIPDIEEKVDAIIKNKMKEDIGKGINVNYNI